MKKSLAVPLLSLVLVATSSAAFGNTQILDSLKQQGVQTTALNDADLGALRGAYTSSFNIDASGATVLSGQPTPSVTIGTKSMYVTYKGWGSYSDYTAYNWIGFGYAPGIRTGFSMLDLKQAAERLGYDAEGVVLPQEAVGKLQGPVIVLLRREKINHFVVLKGAVAGRAFLADPVRGHLRVPLHDFFKEWQGEALVLGREGFGLPLNHPLSIPRAAEAAPEYEAVRALLHVQP